MYYVFSVGLDTIHYHQNNIKLVELNFYTLKTFVILINAL